MSDTSGDTPSSSQLLQQVRVLDCASESDRVADVAIAAGEIQAIAPHLDPTEFAGSVLRDGRGLVLGPGLVNLYGTCSEPGHEERETLAEFLAAAAAGGFTQVAVLPQTVPAIDRPASVALLQQLSMLAKADLGRATPQLHLWGALTPGCDGEGLVELAELAAAGIVGFSDGRPLASWSLLRRSLEYLQPLAIPIAVVPCDLSVRGAGVMREGPLSLQAGLPGDPALSEAIYLAGLLELVAETETPVHIMRLSTARGVALVAQAKAAGLPVTASTTWLHVLLDSRALLGYNSHLRLDPPLGNPDDRAALIAGVKAGTIDALAVDRAAYAYEEKAVAFADALPGALGFELVLPLLWQHLVATGEWTALELWRSLSWGPSQCLGQTPRHCAVGAPAELTLFDP
ncbi:MAG: dihydroorotase, partial [Cyanobacteria bacterium J06641_5]